MVSPSKVESIFFAALDMKTAEERAAYLARACGDDSALRHCVERLLKAHSNAADFLAQPAVDHQSLDTLELDASAPGGPESSSTVANTAHTPDKSGAEAQATGIHTPSSNPDTSPISITALYERDPGAEILIAGRYSLQEKIGEGGMGEVWVAKQSEPVKRKVALKLIKPGMDSRAVLQRFEQERQALALMDHTNIAKVLDAGMTPNGQPFFVMELVNGLPLNKFCDEMRLTPKDRLELFVPICQAVQHAHQKGIVHRDLKPANILVTMIDGRPVPKVIDFGVAKATAGKLTDESLSTQFGAVLGTLEYMSPEQAGFSGEDIDTRADIYSLGVILYELLTGLRPIDAGRLKKAALTEMIRIIREEEPSKPSTRLSTDEALPSLAALRQVAPRRLMTMLRGDLDWLVMKCLEKQRDRRYETANALARDVQRYLNGDAVEACPPSLGYRLSKFLKRNRGKVIAAGFVLLALVAGLIGTTWGLVREAAQKKIAVAEKARAEAREELAIDAVQKFRDAVENNPELKNNPTLDSLRKTLLKEPLAFFRSLRNRLQSDRDTRPAALVRLAEAIHAYAHLTDQIGDTTDGLKAHDDSLAIWIGLTTAHPGNSAYTAGLAKVHDCRGGFLRDTGRPVEAMAAYERGREIWERLVRDQPSNVGFRFNLAKNLSNAAILFKDTGWPDEALADFERAGEMWERLVRDQPADPEFQRGLAMNTEMVGLLLDAKGKSAEGLAALGRAREIWERLARDYPTVADSHSGLASCLFNIGNELRETGKSVEALAAYERGREIWERLARDYPTVTSFQMGLARVHIGTGLALRNTGKHLDALAAFERARETYERLARDHPESPEYASDLGATLNNIAMEDAESGRPSAACDAFREALVWQQKALATNPRDPTYRQFVSNHLKNLIMVAGNLGDDEEVAQARKALAEFEAGESPFKSLDTRLVAVLEGVPPKDNAERVSLARRAYTTHRFGSAARLWGEALAAEPELASDREVQHRYNALRAAAKAASEQGSDDPKPDEAARAKLRRQALEWLTAELKAWKRVSMTAGAGNKELVAKTLAHWKQDADLAAIRDEREIAKLPEAERKEWNSLWADVDALLKRVHSPRP